MEVHVDDDDLDRLETDADFDGGFAQAIVRAFRKRMQFIRAATDERDFYGMRSLHFEKLKGGTRHQYSVRLNDQWRLILEMEGKGNEKILVIVAIEDYH